MNGRLIQQNGNEIILQIKHTSTLTLDDSTTRVGFSVSRNYVRLCVNVCVCVCVCVCVRARACLCVKLFSHAASTKIKLRGSWKLHNFDSSLKQNTQSFWIFYQQHRSMKCSIISNHICQCNLFLTILQQS